MNCKGNDSLDRMVRLTVRIMCGQPVTSRYIAQTFGVSWATAKRDLQRLEAALPVRCEITTVNVGRHRIRHELKLLEAA